MTIEIDNLRLEFEKANLIFLERNIDSAFKTKNNRTVEETLNHPRYKSVIRKITGLNKFELNQPLGDFMLQNKLLGKNEYKLFLNKYGDKSFCHFKLKSHLEDRGLYAWVVNNQTKYIGRCSDNFKKRVNQGYGRISAKNCFIDGQATNCHINSIINKTQNAEFYVYKMNSSTKKEIDHLELRILESCNFDWNIQNNSRI